MMPPTDCGCETPSGTVIYEESNVAPPALYDPAPEPSAVPPVPAQPPAEEPAPAPPADDFPSSRLPEPKAPLPIPEKPPLPLDSDGGQAASGPVLMLPGTAMADTPEETIRLTSGQVISVRPVEEHIHRRWVPTRQK